MTSESPLAAAGTNVPVQTVSELSGALRRAIEQGFGHVRVRGEISGCKRHGSGHIYLALKDADALIDGVCWRGSAAKLAIRPEDGLDVIATGRLTTYPGRSKYQLVIEQMELAGEGAILKMLEERRKRLAAEGLFDTARKRALPYLPGVIGVVTSPTGAVIRDILHRLADRFPRHVLLWPVAVQGEGAAAQIAAAIEGFNRIAPGGPIPRPDLLIVARGGGSLEDLMAFNEEIVVRAAAASAIPLISAVGHETDTTLIDFASDRRAPTPTAAAEMAVPVHLELIAEVSALGGRLAQGMGRSLAERRLHLDGLARGLPDPQRLLETATQRLDDRAERLDLAVAAYLRGLEARVAQAQVPHPRQQIAEHRRHLESLAERLRPALLRVLDRQSERLVIAERMAPAVGRIAETAALQLARLGQLLQSLSPDRVLERGYAVVEDRTGHLLTAAEISPGMGLNLRFHDSTVAARAEGEIAPPDPSPKPVRRPTGPDLRQPKLI
jgi:exodeoxyribonuclease VII large subunit